MDKTQELEQRIKVLEKELYRQRTESDELRKTVTVLKNGQHRHQPTVEALNILSNKEYIEVTGKQMDPALFDSSRRDLQESQNMTTIISQKKDIKSRYIQ